jgi:hypothetical protein
MKTHWLLRLEDFFMAVEICVVGLVGNLLSATLRHKTKKKLRVFSPRANYTDRGTSACRRN